MSAECACGHPDLAHWDVSPGTELRPCGATLPGPAGTADWDYCPCIEFRARHPAPLWMRAVNRVLGGLA